MKIRELAYLAIRVISVYLFVLGVNHLVNLLTFALPNYVQVLKIDVSYVEIFFIAGSPTLILFISSVLLWLFAGRVSGLLVPKPSTEADQNILFHQVEGFVLSVVGLLITIHAFTRLLTTILNYVNILNQGFHGDGMNYMISIGAQAFLLIVGIVLQFRAEGFAYMLRKIRNWGIDSRNS